MHVLCMTYTWRYQAAVQRKVLDEVEEQLDIEADKDINNAEPRKSQMSLRHTVSQPMTIWTIPMADFYYAQQKGRGHVVGGMRLRFQLRCEIRCLVSVFEAWSQGWWCCVLLWSIPPSPSATLTLTLTLTPTEIGTPLLIALRTNFVLVCSRERLSRQMPKSRPFIFNRFPQECMCLVVGENQLKFVKHCLIQPSLYRCVLLSRPDMPHDKANCV